MKPAPRLTAGLAPGPALIDHRAERRRETWLLALLALLLLTQCALRPTPRPHDVEHSAPQAQQRPDRVHQLVNQIRHEYQLEPLPAGRSMLLLDAPPMTAKQAERFRQQWQWMLQGLSRDERLVITCEAEPELAPLTPDPLAEVHSLQLLTAEACRQRPA